MHGTARARQERARRRGGSRSSVREESACKWIQIQIQRTRGVNPQVDSDPDPAYRGVGPQVDPDPDPVYKGSQPTSGSGSKSSVQGESARKGSRPARGVGPQGESARKGSRPSSGSRSRSSVQGESAHKWIRIQIQCTRRVGPQVDPDPDPVYKGSRPASGSRSSVQGESSRKWIQIHSTGGDRAAALLRTMPELLRGSQPANEKRRRGPQQWCSAARPDQCTWSVGRVHFNAAGPDQCTWSRSMLLVQINAAGR